MPKKSHNHTRYAHNAHHPPPPQPPTIEYNPTTNWLKCLHEHKNQYTSIICIHNQRSPPRNQRLAQNLTTNLLELYNVHIKTNHIEHTPIDYKVIFTKPWQTTPNTTPLTPQKNITPLPIMLYHI